MNETYASQVKSFNSLIFQPVSKLPRLKLNGRASWVDMTKAVSIFMVVLWHAVGDRVPLNEALIFLRMPLFFFIAGVFARKNFANEFRGAFFHKIQNFIYLYILWSVILFLLLAAPFQWVRQGAIDWDPVLWMFYTPSQTLWFIYALAISFGMLWLLRGVPVWVVLLVSAVAYCAMVSAGEWRHLDFYDRILRLFPFFVLGIVSYEMLDRLGRQWSRYGPLVFLAFFPVAYFIYFQGYADVGVLTLVVSLWGIFGVILLCRFFQEQGYDSVVSALSYIGSASLYIYVMHRIGIVATRLFLRAIGVDTESEAMYMDVIWLAASVVILIACAIIGKLMAKHSLLGSLFEIPRPLRLRFATAS